MTRYGLVLGVVAGVVFAALAGVLPRVFSPDPTVLATIPAAWWFFVALQPVAGYVFALDGVLLGAADAAFLRRLTLGSALVGFLPLIWLSLAFGWGLAGVWAGLSLFMIGRALGVGLRAGVTGGWSPGASEQPRRMRGRMPAEERPPLEEVSQTMTAPSTRVAVVTGAARGLGAATALRLAADGLAVAVIDLEESAAKGTADAITEAAALDRGRRRRLRRRGVDAAVERIVAELGPPTVLINNAGITRDNLLFKMTENDWDSVMGVHLRGSFLMTKACQGHMVAAQ